MHSQDGSQTSQITTVFLCLLIASPTSHQLHVDRGPAAEGVALKIRRTPRGLQAVMGSQQNTQALRAS